MSMGFTPKQQTVAVDEDQLRAAVRQYMVERGGAIPAIYTQPADPDPTMGNQGDAYLDTESGDVYRRT